MSIRVVSLVAVAGLGVEAVTSGRELSSRDNPHLPHNEYPYEMLLDDANLPPLTTTASFSGPILPVPFDPAIIPYLNLRIDKKR
jgi:hypothetical protein